jgi:hypothetical protein
MRGGWELKNKPLKLKKGMEDWLGQIKTIDQGYNSTTSTHKLLLTEGRGEEGKRCMGAC